MMQSGKKQLPPLKNSQSRLPSSTKMDAGEGPSLDMPYNKILGEYEYELDRLKTENEEIRNAKELAEKNYQIVMNDNNALNLKLENLENVFIGNPITKGHNGTEQRLLSDEYMTANLLAENTELKNNITHLEEKVLELNISLKEKSAGMNLIAQNIGDSMSQVNELMKMKNVKKKILIWNRPMGTCRRGSSTSRSGKGTFWIIWLRLSRRVRGGGPQVGGPSRVGIKGKLIVWDLWGNLKIFLWGK
jgi:hypothetical protein